MNFHNILSSQTFLFYRWEIKAYVQDRRQSRTKIYLPSLVKGSQIYVISSVERQLEFPFLVVENVSVSLNMVMCFHSYK